jgi:DNA polymerase-3 subunit epsilon
MMKKLFFFDCETTGTDPLRHEITQLAYIIDIDGEIKLERSILMRPLKPDTIDPQALTVQGRTVEQLEQYGHPFLGYTQLLADFSAHVDKYDSKDKMIPVACNATFDVSFISEFFNQQKDKYLGSWLDRRLTLDPQALFRYLLNLGRVAFPPQGNTKLKSLAGVLGVTLDNAHDALADVRALREIHYILTGVIQ